MSLLCWRLDLPVIASGKKIKIGSAVCPPTCCALAGQERFGDYGRIFGLPEIEVAMEGETVAEITVIRGAPCGASWDPIGGKSPVHLAADIHTAALKKNLAQRPAQNHF